MAKKRYTSAVWADQNQQALYDRCKIWMDKVVSQLKAAARQKTTKGKAQLGISVSKKKNTEKILSEDIRGYIVVKYGEVQSIRFTFGKHGVYWYIGVSKGHGVSNKRTAVDWYVPILDKYTPELQNIVSKFYLDMAINVFNVYLRK